MAINLDIPDIRGPDDEPLADYLKRKERELGQQVSSLRGMLAPKERELEEVRRAMQAIGLFAPSLESLIREPQANGVVPNYAAGLAAFTAAQPLTIKAMILNALRDYFHEGATPAELRDYMRTVYGKEIDRNSISPQLTRLREQGAVEQSGGVVNPKWKLTRAGKWYGHPNSFEIPNDNGIDKDPDRD